MKSKEFHVEHGNREFFDHCLKEYKERISNIKEERLRIKEKINACKVLSSEIFGNIVTFQDAYKLIK